MPPNRLWLGEFVPTSGLADLTMPQQTMPTQYSEDILGRESAIGSHYPDGNPINWTARRTYSVLSPALGFFPFYDTGCDGHVYGLYWPIGREHQSPIVGYHEANVLIPLHSSINSLQRRERAMESDSNLLQCCNDYLLETSVPPRDDDIRASPGLPGTFEGLLEIDPQSPFYLCAVADQDVTANELDSAEHRYRQAIVELPEYVAAHFGLAVVLRRRQRMEAATIHLRQALIGPLVYWGWSMWSDFRLPGPFRNDWARKALMWLQGAKRVDGSLEDDPYVKSVGKLKLQAGVAVNTDFEVLQGIMNDYVECGQFSEAATIWRLLGELAAYETTSFRERYGLKPASFGLRWAELLDLAGNTRRAALLRNIVSRLEKPDGLYL